MTCRTEDSFIDNPSGWKIFHLLPVYCFPKLQSTADRLENTEARLRMAESDHNTDLESVLIKLEEEQQRYGFIYSISLGKSQF